MYVYKALHTFGDVLNCKTVNRPLKRVPPIVRAHSKLILVTITVYDNNYSSRPQ